jgi:ATP-dependent exoDNAse (exonuclease V) alpha subunit
MHANLHISAITRGSGRNAAAASAYRSGSSVVACAAYRSGEKLQDATYNKTHDYTKKNNVLLAEIITPEGAPEWMNNREKLWNGVEAGEKRKDAQLAKEVVLVLPRNLNHEQYKEVVRGWIADNITKRGLVADFAIHEPDASDGGKNPHAHVMFTLRPVEGEGFGKKLTGYKDGGLDGKEVLAEMRSSYEYHLNNLSTSSDNFQIFFDLRSYKEKGIDRIPQAKIGPKVTYLEKRGYLTEWGKDCRKQIHANNNKPYQKYIGTYHKIGDGNKYSTNFIESIRADVAEKYYDVMYGEDRGVEEWQV